MSSRINFQEQAVPSVRSMRLRLPMWLVLPLGVTLGVAAVMLAVREGAILLAPPLFTDAFSPYQDIVPGQTVSQLSEYACEMVIAPYGSPPPVCILPLEDGAFRQITLSIQENIITGMTFSINSLRVIDLIWRWGQPDFIREQHGSTILWWNRHAYVFARISEGYSLQAQVRYLVTTHPDLSDPCC